MLIDWQRVADLREEIGAEDFAEIAEIFLQEVGEAVDALPPDPGKAAGLAAQMHFVKGATLNLGFTELARLCQRGEELAVRNAVLPSDIAEIRAVFDQSRTEFASGDHKSGAVA